MDWVDDNFWLEKWCCLLQKYDLWRGFNWKMEANRGSLSNYLFMIDWMIKFECESVHDKIYRRINNIVVVYVRCELHFDQ